MADVNLTGDASSLVGALEQASSAFIEFGTATQRITRDVAKLDADGNILNRTLEVTNANGQRVVGTFEAIGNGLGQLIGVTATAETTVAALNTTLKATATSQALLAEATAVTADIFLTELNTLESNTTAKAAAEIASRRFAGAKAIEADLLEITAVILQREADAAQVAAAAELAHANSLGIGTGALEAHASAIIAKDKADVLTLKSTQAALEADIARATGIELVTVAERQRQLTFAAGAAITGGQLEAAVQPGRLASLRAQAEADIAGIKAKRLEEEKNAAARKAEDDRIRAEIVRGQEARTKANQRRTAERRKETAAELRDIELVVGRAIAAINKEEAARKAASNARQAENLKTRRPGIDFRTVGEGGIASRQQVQSFLRAEEAVKKLVRTGKVGFAEMNVAIDAARGKTLLLAQANTIAQREALKLFAAEELVAAGAAQAATSVGELGSSFKSLANLIGISLLIGAAFKLVTAFSEALEVAGELSIKIAEIETITKRSTFSTENWADGLRDLSSAFGLDILDQAEAAYQVLSNQIKNAAGEAIQGAEALKFLDAANKLAITGVTDTASATNLLTAALNSFRIPAENAEVVAAQLFKTVELGRLRIEELAQSFGRIAVPANQLGIELEELLGAIAQVTIQGVKFNEASTLIRGVILKLLRPTDTLKKTFEDLGVASGEALIEQRGFIPALAAIEEAVGGTSTALGKAFGRIRAITGALIFAGKGADEASSSIEEIRKTTIGAFSADTQKIIQTTGQQLAIAGAEARNFFEDRLGTPALKAIAKVIDDLGGMDKILNTVIESLIQLGNVAIAVIVSRILPALAGLKASLVSLNALVAANPWGATLTAALFTILAVKDATESSIADGVRATERANLAVLKGQEETARLTSAILAAQTTAIQREFKERTRVFLQELGRRRGELAKQSKVEITNQEDITRRLKVATAEFSSGLTKQLQVQSRLFKAAEKDVENAGKRIGETFARISKQSIEIDLIGAGLGQQVAVLQEEVVQARERAAAEVEDANLKNFQLEAKRIRELNKQTIDAAIKRSRIEIRLAQDSTEARARLSLATTRREREIAQRRITDIERRQKLLANGGEAQLKTEEQLQTIRSQFEDARSEEDFRAAFKAFNAIRREQEAIEASVRREKELKAEAVKDENIRLGQLEEIRKKREREQKIAEQQENRLKIIQFLFAAISKDVAAFDQEQVFALKSQDELLKSVGEQQARLGKIIALQREIGGGAQADALVRAKAASLERATQLELAKRANDADQEKITSRRELFELELAAAQELRATSVGTLNVFERNLESLENVTENLLKATTPQEQLQAATAFRAATTPPAELEAVRVQTITGEDEGATQANIDAELRTAAALQETVVRLRELSGILRTSPADITEAQSAEFKKLLDSLRKIQEGATLASTQRETGLGGQAKVISDAIITTFGRQGGSPFGDITKVLGEQQARTEAIRLLRVQSRQLEGFLTVKEKERLRTEDGIKELKTFNEALDSAARRIKTIGEVISNPQAVPTAPGLIDANLENLTRDTKDAFIKGASDPGVEDAIADATAKGTAKAAQSRAAEEETRVKTLAQIQAEETVRVENEQRLKSAKASADQLAAFKADAERRATAAATLKERPPEFRPKEVDTGIIIGDANLSIADQQNRIAEELAEVSAARLAFEKAELANKKEQDAIARQKAIEEGRLGVNRAGQLVGRRDPNVPRAGTRIPGVARPGTSRPGRLQADVDEVDPIIDPEAPSAVNDKVLEAIRVENLKFNKEAAARAFATARRQEETAKKNEEVALQVITAQEDLAFAIELRKQEEEKLREARERVEARLNAATQERENAEQTALQTGLGGGQQGSAFGSTEEQRQRVAEARFRENALQDQAAAFADDRTQLDDALSTEFEARAALTAAVEAETKIRKRATAFQIAEFTKGLSEEEAAKILAPTPGGQGITSDPIQRRGQRLGLSDEQPEALSEVTTEMVKAAQALREAADKDKSAEQIKAERGIQNEAILSGGGGAFAAFGAGLSIPLPAILEAIKEIRASQDEAKAEARAESDAAFAADAASRVQGFAGFTPGKADFSGIAGAERLISELFDQETTSSQLSGQEQAVADANAVLAFSAQQAAEALAERTRLENSSIESVIPELGAAGGSTVEARRQDALIAEAANPPLEVEAGEALPLALTKTTESASGLSAEVDTATLRFQQLNDTIGKFRVSIPFAEPEPVDPAEFGARLGFATGGPVSGPGGTDNVPAMLTSGEFVVRKSQAQKFFPQLLAMNAGTLRPRGFADGGPVDVGGINVVVNESSNPQATTRQVVAEINRGLRIGTIKLRRS